MRKALLVLAALALPALARAQAPAPAPSRAVLSDLAWMAGRWVDDSGGNLSEEVWTAPEGDSMMGMWRYVVSGKTRIYELLAITIEPTGIVLRVRHFDPQLVGREDKDKSVELRLVAWKPGEVSFEGPALGAPGLVRLTYSQPTDDTLQATLEKDGKSQGFRFRRAK
jgi:hypothetical protein